MKTNLHAAGTLVKRLAAPALVLTLLLSCDAARRGAGDTGARVVAVVNGRKIIEKELDARAGEQLRALEEKVYQLRKAALDKYVGEILFEQEAKARGLSVEALRQQLTPQTVEVKQEQVDGIYAAHADKYASMTEEEAKRKIRAAMENKGRAMGYEQFVAGLRDRGRVELLLPTVPAAPPVVVNVSATGPAKGAANAPVTLVEFSDFQCPACKRGRDLTRQLAEAYGDRLRIVFKHLPLPMHDQAFGAAQAAFCAGEQGKFWEFHDALFSTADLSAPSLAGMAADLGLDVRAFDACVNSEASRNAVLQDQKEAQESGIRGTPTFVLNGTLIRGAKSLDEFKRLIDERLR